MRRIIRAARARWGAALLIAATLGLATVTAQPPRTASPPSGPTAKPQSTAVVPFKIQVSDDALSDLKQRLARARFADEIPGAEWDYGTNLEYLKSLVTYWRDKYDWRAQERRLNEFEQFKTNIDGLDIHFIHRRSKIPGAAPLLLLNGWPSSVEEYAKVIGPLADPVAHGATAADAFHAAIPSMPGYGFSDKLRERGYNPERMAEVWVKLMARLGYSRYITHGSDWGIAVATHLALKDSAHMTALHLAGCPGGLVGAAPSPPPGTPRPPVSDNLGYQEIQTTKPQTLGQGLSDSPLGLASWISSTGGRRGATTTAISRRSTRRTNCSRTS